MPPEEVTIRAALPEDAEVVGEVEERAFGRADEARLVEALGLEGAVLLSLVAEIGGRVVGHVLFSRMWIDRAAGPVAAVALAPLAVLPERQGQGIGGWLVRDGLAEMRRSGEGIVVVLGHPRYYPRFGFSCEAARELESPFPPESYMALELTAGALEGVSGRVRYAAAFGL